MEKKFLEKLREDSKWNCGHTRNSSEEYSSWNPAYFLPATLKLTTTTLGTTGIALAYAWGNVQKAITGDKLSEQTTLRAAITAWLKMNGITSTVSWPRGENEKDLTNSPFLVCNHISNVDGMLMANELDNPRIMAKAELRKLPMIGNYMDDMGTVWVERGSADSREAARRAIDGHVAQWRPGRKALHIFPEGSTTSGNTIAEFKLGAFRAGLPVRPVILLYFGSSDISSPMYKRNSEGQMVEFRDSHWFGNWLGAGLVSVLIKVCRVHYPTEEEKQDPAVFAANVHRYMKYEYDRLKRKHAEYTRQRKREMETYGLGWTVQESPELEKENASVQGHNFRPYSEAELRAEEAAILERRAKAKEEMMSRQGVAEDAARAFAGAVRSGGGIDPGGQSRSRKFANASSLGGGSAAALSLSGGNVKTSPTDRLPFPKRKRLPSIPNPTTTQLHHTGGISDVEVLPGDVTRTSSRSAAPANRNGAHTPSNSFPTAFSPREASEVGGGRSATATYQLDSPYVDWEDEDDEGELEVFAEMDRKGEGARERIADEILENELQLQADDSLPNMTASVTVRDEEKMDFPIVTEFEELNLNENLLRGIYSYGFEKPSAIQQRGITPILAGRDTIGQAQSGTGKTATFVIGGLQKIDPVIRGVQVVQNFSLYMKVEAHCCTGGTDVKSDVDRLASGCHIIVGTPGRVFDLIYKRHLKVDDINLLVLDEADEMLGNRGFKEQVYDIFKYLPSEVQVSLFSATLPPEILDLTTRFMRSPVRILVKKDELTLEGISEFYIDIDEEKNKLDVLCDLYETLTIQQSIIYCNTKQKANWLAEKMNENDFTVSVIHADFEQKDRERVMREFINGASRVLISTDLLARGIDIQQVSLVINYDLPVKMENYLHRIGRSGRYGRKGVGINFCTEKDRGYLKEIERYYGTQIQEMPEDLEKYL
eukprot:g3424.t1